MHIEYEVEIAKLSSIRIGGKVQALILVEDASEIENAIEEAQKINKNIFFIGAGTNLLAQDHAHDLLLIKNIEQKISIYRETQDFTYLEVSAGLSLATLLNFCQKNALCGLEGLAGIPGQVAGALAMNAGSYGTDISACLEEVRYFNLKHGWQKASLEQAGFGYRHCALAKEQKNFFLSALLKLAKESSQVVETKMKANLAQKKKTQPINLASAGCAFKNPENKSAGLLLDQAGFKGKKHGDMYFSDLHANFLINAKQGNFEQAMYLINMAQEAVKKEFSVQLELEVRVL